MLLAHSTFSPIQSSHDQTDTELLHSVTKSENGWTDGEIAREWLEHTFDPATKEKAGGRTRVLLMDGHSSHYTYSLLEYAIANNIVILGYPPHCTHALQGLDVVCFAQMKEQWKKEIEAFEMLHKRGVEKGDFTGVFGTAYLKAFTPETVKAAFSATGVYPFNRTVISPTQMKPSLATSTQASFPLEQSGPSRLVMLAFRANPPTAFDTDAATHTRIAGSPSSTHPQHPPDPNLDPALQSTPSSSARMLPGPSSHPQSTEQDPESISSPPVTPRRRTLEATFSPSLYTPSKRMRMLNGSLASIEEGSWLVSKAKMTSSHLRLIGSPRLERLPPLPAVNWSVLDHPMPPLSHRTRNDMQDEILSLREQLGNARTHLKYQSLIIESDQSQLVVQNLALNKQNEALYAKENAPEKDRTRIHEDGLGLILTSEKVMDQIRQRELEKKEAEAKKLRRASKRNRRRDAKEEQAKRWKRIQEEHSRKLGEWQVEEDKLKGEGVPAKERPAKPKRQKKPTLDEIMGEVEGDGSMDEPDEDEEEEEDEDD